MILLVDDNEISRQSIAKILRLHGYEVTEAGDARDGLSTLESIHVDLIITDFVMPNISGFQFIAEIRRTWPQTPILLLSAYLTPEVGKIVSDGVEFLSKPIDVPVLLDAISRVIPPQPEK